MNEEGDSRREEGEGVERGKGETGLGEEEMGEELGEWKNKKGLGEGEKKRRREEKSGEGEEEGRREKKPLSPAPTINTIPSTQTPSSSLLPRFCNKEAEAAHLPASVWHPSAHFLCSPDDRHQSTLDAYLTEAHCLRLTVQGWGARPSKSGLRTLSSLCSQQRPLLPSLPLWDPYNMNVSLHDVGSEVS